MIRKSLIVVMAVLMVVISCPLFVVEVSSVTNHEAIQRIESLKDLFPNDSFFSTDGQACSHTSSKRCDNCELTHILQRDDLKDYRFSDGGSWTCLGFAKFAWYFIHGKVWSGSYDVIVDKGEFNKNFFSKAVPGDMIYFFNGSGEFCHAAIFAGGVTDTSAVFYHSNTGGKPNKVSYGSWNYSAMSSYYGKGSFPRLLRIKGYDSESFVTTVPDEDVVNANNNSDKPFSGVYRIQTALDSNKFLDISGQNKEDGDNVHIWDRYDVPSQQFVIKPNGDYYSIINVNSGKALCIKGDSKKSGANVHQWSVHSGDSQKWQFEDAGDGYYYIKSALGNYLDVDNAGTRNGTNVQVYKGNRTKAQKWKLIPIDSSVSTPSVTYSNISNGNYYISNDGYEMSVLADKPQRDSINAVSGNGIQFSITKDGDYYLVKPISGSGNYVLNVWWSNNRSTENGDEVSLYKNTHDGSQRWYFEACNGGYLIHPGDATHLSITRDTNTNKLYVKTTTKQANQIWKLNTQPKETKKYYLDLNGFLGGAVAYDIKNWGTCDIYINGERVANDVNDFYTAYPLGTQYEIKDIQSVSDKEYKGVREGKIRGTIEDSDVNVVLEFVTKTSVSQTITYNANGGVGAPSSQSFNGSTVIISKTVPTKSGYVFTGWATSVNGNVRFVPGQTYIGESATLYAKWARRFQVNGIGTVVKHYLHTDIVARVDGKALRSFNIDGNTAIIAEDLVQYGFNVFWNAEDRTLLVGEGDGSSNGNYSSPAAGGKVGTFAGYVYATDIATYINGQAALSYNIGGMTAIFIDDLATFGNVKWDANTRTISFNRR